MLFHTVTERIVPCKRAPQANFLRPYCIRKRIFPCKKSAAGENFAILYRYKARFTFKNERRRRTFYATSSPNFVDRPQFVFPTKANPQFINSPQFVLQHFLESTILWTTVHNFVEPGMPIPNFAENSKLLIVHKKIHNL